MPATPPPTLEDLEKYPTHRVRRPHRRSAIGVHLYASSRRWNLNHGDAFSAMRLDSHRNFLRMRIKDDEVTIYPIGLGRVPRRDQWRVNTQRVGSAAPAYVPTSPLTPRLIEGPITVRSLPG